MIQEITSRGQAAEEKLRLESDHVLTSLLIYTNVHNGNTSQMRIQEM